jgi:hypothetical protein
MKRKNKPQLAVENAADFSAKIENEGDMLYVCQNWDFKEFKDKKFNSLRKALVKAAQDMIDYCAFERLENEPEDEGFAQGDNLDDEFDSKECMVCGDALDRDGFCSTCLDRD